MEEETIVFEQEAAPRPSIAVGDVVRLKSGGELMTVRDVKEGEATCLFFAASEGLSFLSGPGTRSLQSYRVPVVCLRVA